MPIAETSSASTGRISFLDAIRGIASLEIAFFWHYSHFARPYQLDSLPIDQAPFFYIFPFSMLYKFGYAAVDVFFILSGLVFSYVYWDKIVSSRLLKKCRVGL
jgi:peptidoglycan/LPS O-acetylase OafA/YrhL